MKSRPTAIHSFVSTNSEHDAISTGVNILTCVFNKTHAANFGHLVGDILALTTGMSLVFGMLSGNGENTKALHGWLRENCTKNKCWNAKQWITRDY